MRRIKSVSSSEFAGRFGQWSFTAQSAPVMVTNQKTGVVLGYFISAGEFEDYMKVRDHLPKAAYAWEMPADLAAELEKPLAGALEQKTDFDFSPPRLGDAKPNEP